MEKELVDLQPVLQKTATEVEEMMVVIKKDTEEADKTKLEVSAQEAEANVKAAEAKAIADDAQVGHSIPSHRVDAHQNTPLHFLQHKMLVPLKHDSMPLSISVSPYVSFH